VERFDRELVLPPLNLAQLAFEEPPREQLSAPAGALVRMTGHFIRRPGVFHAPPGVVAFRNRKDGKRVIASSTFGTWTDFDSESHRNDYVVEFRVPRSPGRYQMQVSTYGIDPLTKQKAETIVVAEYSLTVTPPR
jgi:hypothetical protein